MTDPSDEMLMALADDQIVGPEAEALHRRIMADPALVARFAVFVESRAALEAAFAPGETPQSLTNAIRSASPGEPPSADRVVVPFRLRLTRLVPTAIATSLLIAVGVGGFLAGRTLGPISVPVAPGALAAADLGSSGTGAETILSGGGIARVLGTYMTDQGLCRLINLELSEKYTERAVVCRDVSRNWVVVAAVTVGQGESFIPASDTATVLIDQVLDDLGAGPALTPEQEAAALERPELQ
jgi:hypothetical protein